MLASGLARALCRERHRESAADGQRQAIFTSRGRGRKGQRQAVSE